ncbi:ABC transporter ATP-binding protein [Staphylococcus simiae]|uniref:ABC transporter ATP-binding protein n=1 Tax=Staphylococcus simiae TaxID=308354 RepID=UPI001A9713DD|nr:ABC transporter ATP-binding protein [Staphylococcus simiae]MBO1198868.1 ABC transporter ATP-binding protein [Staphylococcus simiae]MBO1201106.1 ABC transporter ATP-binding protein [Staphylococcus simiae]MBO1203268.1 ABC transporter ATP-binding protein [Staphylococcus simiae]MBO1210783.1 ABC transporter ATP-binding protein [Staphylococcus simiae]MBO1229444.1 ABC transporter ATP-binding protein [Staphylococcus simiae]
MINIHQLQHCFGAHRVIDDFNLTINEGEIVTFIGKSGCGKSTLLNIIGGFMTPTTGEVMIDNKLKQSPSPDCLMIFQQHNLLPWKNIIDNVRLGLTSKVSDDCIDEHLASVELHGKGHQFPEQLSGGMKQRVAICRAQVHQPKVILMDEPLGALDVFTRYKLQDQLLQLKRQTTATMILVTHDIDEALYLSDRIVLLGEGCRIINQYTISETQPRNRNDSHLLKIRNDIMEEFALVHHAVEPEYYL